MRRVPSRPGSGAAARGRCPAEAAAPPAVGPRGRGRPGRRGRAAPSGLNASLEALRSQQRASQWKVSRLMSLARPPPISARFRRVPNTCKPGGRSRTALPRPPAGSARPARAPGAAGRVGRQSAPVPFPPRPAPCRGKALPERDLGDQAVHRGRAPPPGLGTGLPGPRGRAAGGAAALRNPPEKPDAVLHFIATTSSPRHTAPSDSGKTGGGWGRDPPAAPPGPPLPGAGRAGVRGSPAPQQKGFAALRVGPRSWGWLKLKRTREACCLYQNNIPPSPSAPADAQSSQSMVKAD